MKRTFNLAEWAVTHRPFVTFFMIALLAAGAWSYLRLGRSEDPPFTVKVMIVQARWPGATIADTGSALRVEETGDPARPWAIRSC